MEFEQYRQCASLSPAWMRATLSCLRREGEWGSQLSVQLASAKFQTNILVVDRDAQQCYLHTPFKPQNAPVWVLLLETSHFQMIPSALTWDDLCLNVCHVPVREQRGDLT
eukprot:6320000-Amphidinium_carterae.1